MARRIVPLYQQLRELLTEKIESGEWEPGHRLPTEHELMAEFAVSRATVRQCMQLLQSQGLVERMAGRGTFAGRPKVAHNLLTLFTTDGDSATAGDSHMEFQHLLTIKPNPRIASRLDLSPDDEVYELKRTILVGAEPTMVITSWLPVRLFPDLESRGIRRFTVRRIVREFYGNEDLSQHKEVEVTILDEEESALLRTRAGAPALLLTYLTRLNQGRAIEYRKMVVRGDRCKYYVDLDTAELLL
jgi:GntR family transcriptional regulator